MLGQGQVLLERYPPQWAAAPSPRDAQLGDVHITVRPGQVRDDSFDCEVTYGLGDTSWVQRFTAANVTDVMLQDEAAAAGLTVESWLSDTWARLTPL